jgi:hypothetical protein
MLFPNPNAIQKTKVTGNQNQDSTPFKRHAKCCKPQAIPVSYASKEKEKSKSENLELRVGVLVLPVVVVLEGAVAWADIRDLGNLDVREGESVGTIRLDFLVLGLGGGDEDALWLTELTCDYTVGGLGHDLFELLALLGDGVGGGTVLVLDIDDLVGGYVLVDLLHDIGSVLVLDGGHDEMLQVDLVLGFEFLNEAGNVMLLVRLLTCG